MDTSKHTVTIPIEDYQELIKTIEQGKDALIILKAHIEAYNIAAINSHSGFMEFNTSDAVLKAEIPTACVINPMLGKIGFRYKP